MSILAQAASQQQPGGRLALLGWCSAMKGPLLAGMPAVVLDSRHLKDATEWSAVEVHAFLESVVPAPPCIDNLTYTSGYVLFSLDKEDLRRQTRDDEAANIMWAEFRKCRQAKGADDELKVSHARGGLDGDVKVRNEVAFELDVHPLQRCHVVLTVIRCPRLLCEAFRQPADRQPQHRAPDLCRGGPKAEPAVRACRGNPLSRHVF